VRHIISALVLILSLHTTSVWADLEVGQPFPIEFAPPLVGGGDLDLTDYEGKVVVLAFWATWCRPCIEEFPYLVSIQNQATEEHVRVVAVSWNESKRIVRRAIRQLPDTGFVYAMDRRGRYGDALGVESIPHTIVIGPDGLVKYQNIGFSETSIMSLVDAINTELRLKQQSDASNESQPTSEIH